MIEEGGKEERWDKNMYYLDRDIRMKRYSKNFIHSCDPDMRRVEKKYNVY